MKRNTSWEKSSQWYHSIVGEKGHYYHQEVIFPKLPDLFPVKEGDSVLDLGCGQGVLGRLLPKEISYCGIDLSPTLVKQSNDARILVADATKKLPIKERKFTHAISILALQNMENPLGAIDNMCKHLVDRGKGLLILNHPCFRIPRQSHWGVDESRGLQYRKMDLYHSEIKIPIETHPGKKGSDTTWSYHFPLQYWFNAIAKSAGVVLNIEELYSNKKSTGKRRKMENRAREEFPLFLAIAFEKRPI